MADDGGTPIYLDHNATTPLAPGVFEVMTAYLSECFGNPSSSHRFGQTPRHAVETARKQLAELIGSDVDEIVFTGCGSEANTLAITGVGGHAITQVTEHPAVLETCRALPSHAELPVDRYGLVDPEDLEKAIRYDTRLVSIMHANNETGTIQPIAELAAIAHEKGALFHTDAAQTVGKIPVDVEELGVDLMTIAAHKFGGPKGVGALYVRRGVQLKPLILGGGQERGLRSGTENVAGIAGLGAAAAYAKRTVHSEQVRQRELRDRLHRLLNAELHGHPEKRLPNTLNVRMSSAEGVAASAGSACHHGAGSPVLAAMGIAGPALRLSLGRTTTVDDVEAAAKIIVDANT